jgi:hypothetical protein
MDAELQKIIERYGGLAIILILLAAGWFAMRLHRGQRLREGDQEDDGRPLPSRARLRRVCADASGVRRRRCYDPVRGDTTRNRREGADRDAACETDGTIKTEIKTHPLDISNRFKWRSSWECRRN